MGQTISYETTEYDLDLGPKGTVRGLQYDQKARRYAGIPYALPPTGIRRWRKPQPLPASFVFQARKVDGDDLTQSPFDAIQFRDACPQKAFAAVQANKDDNTLTYSEDCLYVNIWTPVEKPGDGKKKWPVFLWCHGGWFAIGNASQTADMSPVELISTGGLDAIVVAIGCKWKIKTE